MSPSQLTDSQGRPIVLGKKLAEGGEGAVFLVPSSPDLVAKMYLQPPDAQKQSKLILMSQAKTPELLRIAAWPIDTLHPNGPRGPASGFLMPKVDERFRVAHQLYGPQSRRKYFPNADWQYLLHTGMNAANAFAVVHAKGHVIGDVNAGNLLVSQRDATVRLIDCDSFQMKLGGSTYPCEVGVPEYTPPELQGQRLDDKLRTQNHDQFGLAVLIFHLLFVGRHPFQGTWLDGDMDLSTAIKGSRFVFGANAATMRMKAGPFAPPLSMAGPDVASLFERAFADKGRLGGRPTATEWASTLSLSLKQLVGCQFDTAHKFHRAYGKCPWCEIVAQRGPAFFISVGAILAFSSTPGDLEPLWSEIKKLTSPNFAQPTGALSRPPPALHLPIEQLPLVVSNLARGALIGGAVALWLFLALGIAFAGVGAAVGGAILLGVWAYAGIRRRASPILAKRREIQSRYEAAQKALESALSRSSDAITKAQVGLSAILAKADQLRRSYLDLQSKYDADLRKLEEEKERIQRRDFLENELLDSAVIDSVGPKLKASLQSYQIESAWDVLNADLGRLNIPKVGPARQESLKAWANAVSAAFRFDPQKAISEADRRMVVVRYRQLQLQMKAELQRHRDSALAEAERAAGTVASALASVNEARRRSEDSWTELASLSVG